MFIFNKGKVATKVRPPVCLAYYRKQTIMNTQLQAKLEISGAVLFYTTTAIASVIANKYYLRSVHVPVTFLWLQLVVSTVLLVAGFSMKRLVSRQEQENEAPKLTQKQVLKELYPMILFNAFGLAFNIVCLSKIDSIMHQVTRGMTLPLTAMIGPIFKNDSGGWRVHSICFVIFLGFLIAVSGEFGRAKLSLLGVTAGVAASLINAINAQVIKKSYANNRFSAIDLVFYNNIYSMLALLPLALTYEQFSVLKTTDWKNFTIATLVTGGLGFLINYAGFLQIKVTSPVTHCVSCASRGVLQVIASCLLLKEHVSATRAAGLGVSLLGSSLYPVIKSIDNRRHQKHAKVAESEYSSVGSPNSLREISINHSVTASK